MKEAEEGKREKPKIKLQSSRGRNCFVKNE